MATKFPPGQDMEDISPKDLEEAKKYTKERKAYKEASNIGPNTADKKSKEKPQEKNYLAERGARLKKVEDETNVHLSFTKRDGKTSYGFLIPEDINQDVLNNIDTITKETKQKLLNESTTNNI